MIRQLLLTTFSLCAGIAAVQGSQVCDLNFSSCPGAFAGDTINVGQDVISLDAHIPLCLGSVKVTTGDVPPISIMFIIDHSRSMWGTDPTASRYTVVSQLLETVKAVAPTAEVGFSIFNSSMIFDSRDDAYLMDAFPNDPGNQYNAVVPLTTLNHVFSNGVSGIDTLKDWIKVSLVQQAGLRDHFELVHRTTRRTGDGTNIEEGFLGALAAMAKSKAKKENQFFIFLSDGESNLSAGFLTTLQTTTPTTFTVYFTDPSQPPAVPQTIADITAKVKGSAYSTSNSKSAYWATNLPGNELENILRANIIGKILDVPTKPKQVSVDLTGSSYSSSNFDSAGFLFSRRMALSPKDTKLALSFTNTYIDSMTGNPKDTVLNYGFTVRRVTGAPALPAGFTKTCREQASLELYNAGQPLTTVAAAQSDLQIHLKTSVGDTCDKCAVGVSPSQSNDRESITLSAASGFYQGPFTQTVSTNFQSGNAILEHLESDSLVLIYVNPENHLDSIRRAWQFIPAPPPIPTKVATPTANPTGKKFLSTLQVTLATATPGAVIYYTLDGSDPSPTGGGTSLKYTGPVSLSSTTVIKAIAVEDKWIDSDVMTETYTFTPPIGVSKAWYLDKDGDGRIETVMIVFAKALVALPDTLSFQLGGGGEPDATRGASAAGGSIAFSGSDHALVTVTLPDPFPPNVTDVRVPATAGHLFAQDNNPLVDGAFAVADSVAPVIVTADIQAQTDSDSQVRIIITVSEPSTAPVSSQTAFVFKRDGKEIASGDVKLDGITQINPSQFEIVVDSMSVFFPIVGDSVAINNTGEVKDAFGNAPMRKFFQVLGGVTPRAKPTRIFVTFANGGTEPGKGGTADQGAAPNFIFIPIDKSAHPLGGESADGKCPACYIGQEGDFIGPVINLEIPGAVDFDFKIFSTLGEFVVAGRGTVRDEDLPSLTPIKNGTQYAARIVWTGRTAKGDRAGTGAYVLSSMVTTRKNFKTGAPPATETRKLLFGLLRN